MNTEELLNILIFFYLQEFCSGRELLKALLEDAYLLLHAHNPVDWYPWGTGGAGKGQT